jgi:hypothetical protein
VDDGFVTPSPPRRQLAPALALLLVLVLVPAPGEAGGRPAFPLVVSVAEEEGKPVAEEAWIAAQVESANRLLGPCGATFERQKAGAVPARFTKLETRADRDALGAFVKRGAATVHVFIVGSLRDVDEPENFRLGVHWRSRRYPGRRYVILTGDARPTTLAHELGHYFGNGHTAIPDNLMSYERTGGEVSLARRQCRVVAREARRLASGPRR